MHVCAPLPSATQSSCVRMRLVVNESAKAAMDASRLATCCSSPDTIFSSTVPCNVEGSPARTAEPPAVADSASKAKPTTLQPPTIREFHLLFMFCSRLQARETGAEKRCQCRHRHLPHRHGGTGWLTNGCSAR